MRPMSDGGAEHLSSEEQELLERARRGEPEAFEQIFLQHRNQIYALSYRMTGNAADAEDLCQEVFITALRKISGFEGRSSLSTWLYRVAVNRSRDYLRKKKRTPEMLMADERRPGEDALATPEPQEDPGRPERAAVRSETRAVVHEALAQLPPGLRIPLVLHELEGFEYVKVARMMRLPVGTVKSRIFRARLRLADILEPHKEQWE